MKRELRDMHAYIFTWRTSRDGTEFLAYERTMPASCLTEAFKWIREHGRRGFVSVGCLPERYFR